MSKSPKSPTYKINQSRKYDDNDFKSKNYNKPNLKREDSRGNDSTNIDSRSYKQKYVNKNSKQ